MYIKARDVAVGDVIVLDNIIAKVVRLESFNEESHGYNRGYNYNRGGAVKMIGIKFEYPDDHWEKHRSWKYGHEYEPDAGVDVGTYVLPETEEKVRLLRSTNVYKFGTDVQTEHRSVLEEIAVELDKRMSG